MQAVPQCPTAPVPQCPGGVDVGREKVWSHQVVESRLGLAQAVFENFREEGWPGPGLSAITRYATYEAASVLQFEDESHLNLCVIDPES